ncbi:hypothetical protein WJU23_14285 [Prosthecobacter sp. SYSU 5D2]|uniref:hypothetical protein n=1 Tax=Prosthecobacter sp. SYSU 5D2 TaxID=3134134 RepID=UPI0031FE7C0E
MTWTARRKWRRRRWGRCRKGVSKHAAVSYIAVMSVKESIIQNLYGLSEKDLEQVADFVNRLNQDADDDFEVKSADPQREALEDILEARDKGPFIPVPDNLTEIVMEKVRQRLSAQGHHA